jgi:hypothetical protein
LKGLAKARCFAAIAFGVAAIPGTVVLFAIRAFLGTETGSDLPRVAVVLGFMPTVWATGGALWTRKMVESDSAREAGSYGALVAYGAFLVWCGSVAIECAVRYGLRSGPKEALRSLFLCGVPLVIVGSLAHTIGWLCVYFVGVRLFNAPRTPGR